MWALGAVLNIIGSVLISFGMAMMKLGHALHEALQMTDMDSAALRTPIYRVSTWQRGAGLYLIGNLLSFFSYAFAAQTLLLALSSLQFVTHLASAVLLEGVKVPRRSMAAAGVILASNVLLVAFGSRNSTLLDAAEIIQLHRCACEHKCKQAIRMLAECVGARHKA